MTDLISREEAISTTKSMLYQTAINSVESDEKAALLYEDIADNRIETWLGLVDPVDVAPAVHGRWIDVNPDVLLDPRMQCSICGSIEHPLARWKYCPHCGAKIDDKKKGDKRE